LCAAGEFCRHRPKTDRARDHLPHQFDRIARRADLIAPALKQSQPGRTLKVRDQAADGWLGYGHELGGGRHLSREHDGYTQQLLLEGLRDPKKALVPADKALQLLSYDVHSDAYPVAREIVRNPPNQRAKREAMRLLAADANSVGMFETILGDKKEAPEIRQLSATALYSLAPKKLESMARKIVLDKKDDHKVKATSLTALASFGGKSIAKDKPLIAQVKKLEGKAGSTAVKRGANQFLRKYVP